MRFLYAKLVGYIGVYNGLGKSSIEIDFSKAKNKICVVSGPNGTGKSTIVNALNLMPDGNENFVPSMSASKFLKLTDGENIYEITFNHPIDKNNNRAVTKVSIMKNGAELNPNGNVSSYKDIIFAEFDLDSNYTVLSKISGENRGLADKKPAERKKIMSSIISSLEVYNNIYKNLNKKANIFKSYINNLSSKIQNIGDEEYLQTTLASIIARISELNILIDDAKRQVTESKTIIAMNDPDGSIQTKYNSIVAEMKLEKEDIDKEYRKLSAEKDENLKELDSLISTVTNTLNTTKEDIAKKQAMQKGYLENISSYGSEVDRLKIKIDKIGSDIDNNLIDNLNSYKKKLEDIEKEFSGLGISSIEDTSKEEVEFVINFLSRFILEIDSLYEQMSEDSFEYIYKCFTDKDTSIEKDIDKAKEGLRILEEMDKIEQEGLEKINKELATCIAAEQRPKNCKDDTCPYIKDSVEILNKYGSIEKIKEDIELQEHELEKNVNYIKIANDFIENLQKMSGIYTRFRMLTDSILANESILRKFSITSDITSAKIFKLIRMEYRFNSVRNLDKYLEISNMITEYKTDKNIVQNLQSEYTVQYNNITVKEGYEAELKEKSELLEKYKAEYNKISKEVLFSQQIIDSMEERLKKLVDLKSSYDNWEEKQEEYNKLDQQAKELFEKFKSSASILTKISELEQSIVENQKKLKPLEDQRRSIESQLTMLNSFKTEYAAYNEKYTFVDKLRKYSSPTQGSIQSLFMSIYMDKTLSMVNQLLGMIFGGQYQILDYVINEDEFRIPFVGNGLVVDDISSGSTSQVCIMGMIINLVLYNMAGSKYGIVSLDEIDGGLDQNNRYLFVDVLQKICNILNIDQLFIISHSVESALNSVDVILMSNSEEYKDLFRDANIIFTP